MATIELDVLEAAFTDGLFKRPLTTRQRSYLKASIVTASDIIRAIDDRADDGIDIASLAHEMQCNENTIRIHTRWLRSKQLIDWEKNNGQNTLIYFSNKSRFAKARK